MVKCDILINGYRILKPDVTVPEETSVVIHDLWIKEVGPTGEIKEIFQAPETLDGKGMPLVQGLVDGHTHVCQQLLRGRVSDEYPMVWIGLLVSFEDNLRPDDSYINGQLACPDMIKSGTTSSADSSGIHIERVADAVLESVTQATIAKFTTDIGNAVTGAMKETAEEAIMYAKGLYKAHDGKGDGRISIWLAARQIMICSWVLVAMARDVVVAELNTGIHAHLREYKNEVSFCLQNHHLRPAQFLKSMGVLDSNLLTAHNVIFSDEDIAMMTRRGVKVIHRPRTNLSNHGSPKTLQMLQVGLNMSLGCDGTASSNLDLFDEMKALHCSMIAYQGLPFFNPMIMSLSHAF